MMSQRRMSSGSGYPSATEPRSRVVELTATVSSTLNRLIKKPHALPLLLFLFLVLTWVSLKLQHSSSNSSQFSSGGNLGEKEEGGNLVAFRSGSIRKDKRGWALYPVALAKEYGIKGGAVGCESVHVGEILPGGVRGNHRHHYCNETFLIWGALTLFRLENKEIDSKGYTEVIVGADQVAVAASPSGAAHALKNVDPLRTTYFIACQDRTINYNSSTTDFNVWPNL